MIPSSVPMQYMSYVLFRIDCLRSQELFQNSMICVCYVSLPLTKFFKTLMVTDFVTKFMSNQISSSNYRCL